MDKNFSDHENLKLCSIHLSDHMTLSLSCFTFCISGAFGYFEVTSDEITKYCKAKLFSGVGKRTPIAVRFSTVGEYPGQCKLVKLSDVVCSMVVHSHGGLVSSVSLGTNPVGVGSLFIDLMK